MAVRAHLSLWRMAPLALLGSCALPTGSEQTGEVSQAASVCPAGAIVHGVDVSSYQATIDWAKVKGAGVDFAIARISDGNSLDTDFAANWAGMKAAGLIRGSYQYFEPADDPVATAKIVVQAVGMLGPGDLPVAADMEATGGQSAATIASKLQTWMTAVQAGTGKAPIIYTAESFWNTSVNSATFSSVPLWVANYGVTCPNLPNDWSSWLFWQSSGTGTIAGVTTGGVDLDEFNGTLAQLQAFANAPAADGGVPDASAAGTYGAKFVSQSWPLATTPLAMTTCDTVAATITLANVGTMPWDGNTRLATTGPRGRASLFADGTWISSSEAAKVSGTVPPGGTYTFKFNFHAPPDAGSYAEYFGLVEQGGPWFSAPGQAGPPDNDLEAAFQVTPGGAACVADPGVPDGSVPGDGGESIDAGGGEVVDGGTFNDGGASVADASLPNDAGGTHPPVVDVYAASKGCSCEAAGPRGTSNVFGAWGVAAFAVIAARSRGRRRAPRRSCVRVR